MYGYASEILPYIMGLLQDNNTNLSNTTNSVAPAGEENAPVSKTAKRPAPRGNATARQPAPAPRQQAPSAPLPPRRPNAQGPEMPVGLLNTGNSTQDFLRSQGIGVPATPMAAPQQSFPRIDSGPAASSPQGPTWNLNGAAGPQLPASHPNVGPPVPPMQSLPGMQNPAYPYSMGAQMPPMNGLLSQGQGPTLPASHGNVGAPLPAAHANMGPMPPQNSPYGPLPKGDTYMYPTTWGIDNGGVGMRSNSPQDILPKGHTAASQGPNGLNSGLSSFLAQYLYGG